MALEKRDFPPESCNVDTYVISLPCLQESPEKIQKTEVSYKCPQTLSAGRPPLLHL